jgi:DNA mismatch repair protein MutL
LEAASFRVPDFDYDTHPDITAPNDFSSHNRERPPLEPAYGFAPEASKFATWDAFREEAPARGYLDAPPGNGTAPEPEKLYAASVPADGPAYLGQLGGAYLILRTGDRLLLVDQHAAHERVLFDAFKQARNRGESRPLAMPLTLSTHPSEARRLEEIWPDLKKLGFTLDASEPGALTVREVPACLSSSAARDYLADALAGKTDSADGMWALMACKSAIKAGQTLARDEALSLIEAWRASPDKDYCPHGRPVAVSWTMGELEKLFKRKP